MAGAGKKTFTAGEVLTASDVNNYLGDQAVMYFGGTAARSSAIPTPTIGMTSYRGDTKQIESYDGAEWRGMSGLQLVKKQTIGSGVSTVTVTNAFSATYENYKIVISGGVGSTASNLQLKLGASATQYYAGLMYVNFTAPTYNGANQNNESMWAFMGAQDTNALRFNVDLLAPYLAKFSAASGPYMSEGGAGFVAGQHKVATSYTDFAITAGAGTMTGGTIYVYGYGAS